VIPEVPPFLGRGNIVPGRGNVVLGRGGLPGLGRGRGGFGKINESLRTIDSAKD
jgi:hypothetical protein